MVAGRRRSDSAWERPAEEIGLDRAVVALPGHRAAEQATFWDARRSGEGSDEWSTPQDGASNLRRGAERDVVSLAPSTKQRPSARLGIQPGMLGTAGMQLVVPRTLRVGWDHPA